MSNVFSATDSTLARMVSNDASMIKAQTGLSAKKIADIDASAKDFESMFISQMLSPMFESVETDPLFGGGEAEDTWKSMMIEQYGKEVASAGGIGLSGDIKAAMIKMQEDAQKEGAFK